MRKEGFMKKGMAASLVGVLALSAFALYGGNAWAADPIDLTKTCSLTIEVESGSQFEADLDQMTIPVDLYKVADVDVSGSYTELTGFEGIGLDGVSDATTADEWLTMAETAAGKLTDASVPTESIQLVNGSAVADALEAGMYLVVPAETYNADYSYLYQFTPYLTALPGNDYYNSGNYAWDYDPVIGLKAEREEQYGGLTINKNLLNFNSLTQGGYFVFQIEGEKDGVKYSNVTSVNMSEAETGSAYVDGIPVGMTVTVTEVYSGGSYEPVGSTTATATIVADQTVEAGGSGAAVTFENDYNDKLIPGTGVLNQFTAPEGEGDWTWEQVDGNVEAQ